MATSNQFSAASSALGYIAQVHYALVEALRPGLEPDTEISIETDDDFVFEPQGIDNLKRIYQAKYHLNPKGIGDKDVDLWKSLGNWIENFDSASPVERYLLTTAEPKPGSAASFLGSRQRNIDSAVAALTSAAQDATAEKTQPYRDKFLAMSQYDKNSLLHSIYVVGGMPKKDEILNAIKKSLQRSVLEKEYEAVAFRLMGWWDSQVHTHLTAVAAGERHCIRVLDINQKIIDISRSISNGNLPLDFAGMDESNLDNEEFEEMPFVHQLRWVKLGSSRLALAILEYAQAYRQRSQWQSDGLVPLEQMQRYDREVRREWAHYFADLEDNSEMNSEAYRVQALKLYVEMQKAILPEVSPGLSKSYVSRGSLHMLANQGHLGWCKDWRTLFAKAFPDLWQSIEGAA